MALRIDRATSGDQRHAEWKRIARRICDEQINQGWSHQLFRLVRSVFRSNNKLSDEGGFVFNWIAQNYVDAAVMLVRREMDKQDGTENLKNLLDDIIRHPEVLTRERYVAQWPRDEVAEANRAFDSFAPVRVAGQPQQDYIDPAVVRADLAQLETDAERLREHAERTRAHRSPDRGVDRTVTFRELHRTIADIRRVVDKYNTLLTLGSYGDDWEPHAQYDTLAPFTKPWVEDATKLIAVADDDTTE